ncbi:AI-2E family transporter [Phormidium yuhuli AB48]|uniref:AI-2E family transporter n=1 Tax=Phormidium yuhuli AB48 TaxID=2940671 RepID=A0ABY5AN08_9CYAN|nr:AI-2E family transporter [Phormidium yuhuli]USR90597.1 AI-2E family transporter [Phormidium yuhuli AB48]
MKLGDWIAVICFVIALVIIWEFREALLLVMGAVVLSIALNSLVRLLQTWGDRLNMRLSRGMAVFLAIVLVGLFGTLFFALVAPPFINQFQQLIELAPIGFQRFLNWLDKIRISPPVWLNLEQLQLPNFSELAQQVGPLAQNVIENFFTFFSNSLAVLVKLLFVLVLTVMFLVDPTSYRKLLIRLFPSFYRRRADSILSLCEEVLLGWMGGIVINSLFVAILSAIGLGVLQVRFVFAHALLAGVFNFVPNIGPMLSVIFPISVALLDSPLKALGVLILYLVIQNVESYWFSPMVMRKQISLLPAVTLTAQIFFATFLGLLGLILALPLAVVTKTWLEEAFFKDFLDRWGGNPRRQISQQMVTLEEAQLSPGHGEMVTEGMSDPWES